MQITAEIDIDDLVEAIVDNDPIDFIMAIDESVGDEGFTEDLLLRLVQSYEKEYITYEEHITSKVLECTFDESAVPDAPWSPKASDLVAASSKREKLSAIVSLLKSLND